MNRRKFLIGAGGTVIGANAIAATWAFESVEAQRTVSVRTASDPNAYLGLTDESEYARIGGDGKLILDFTSPTAEGGTGLNKNATTMFLHVFSVHNHGENIVGIQIDNDDLNTELAPGHMHFFIGEQGGETLSAYSREDMFNELDYDDPDDDDRVLRPGEELPVGLYFLNDDITWDNVSAEITINALDEGTAEHVAP